jgi:PAS domain S-box-containing protein
MQSDRIEKILDQREQELADFVDNATVALHWVGEDGKILWVNQAELDLLGYTREEYIGHPITEFHADFEVIDTLLKQLAAGVKVNNYEARLRCKDGSIRHVLINSSVRFEEGQFVHTRCFTIDITERKKTEERILTLYQLTSALSEALTPAQAAKIIMEQCVAAMGASAGSIVLLNKDKTSFKILFSMGYSEQLLQIWQGFPINSPILLAECVRSQQAQWVQSFEELQGRFPDMQSQYEDRVYNAWAAIPLVVEKRILGALGLSFSTPQSFEDSERYFMIALAQQCAQALERTRLSEERQERAIVEERQRLGRDLHDSVSQTLFTISSLAQLIPRTLNDTQRAQNLASEIVTFSQKAMAEMKTLLLELHPSALINMSLRDLFTLLVDTARSQQPLNIEVDVQFEQKLPEKVHIVFYRVAQEAINNVVKHSHATQGSIRLNIEAGYLTLRIQDQGVGFDVSASSIGLGLNGMRERAATISATLEINSQLGIGTDVILKWVLPL